MGSEPMPTCAPYQPAKEPSPAMCSTATMAETMSSSMPPYCSGMVMPVSPDRKRADAHVRAVPAGEGTVAGHVFHRDHGGNHVQFHAAVLLGNGNAGKSQFGCLAQACQ